LSPSLTREGEIDYIREASPLFNSLTSRASRGGGAYEGGWEKGLKTGGMG